jgi:hypothetical protein
MDGLGGRRERWLRPWWGDALRSARLTRPDQHTTLFIHSHALAVDEFLLERLQRLIIELKLHLERPVRHPLALTEEVNNLIEDGIQVHLLPSRGPHCRRLAKTEPNLWTALCTTAGGERKGHSEDEPRQHGDAGHDRSSSIIPSISMFSSSTAHTVIGIAGGSAGCCVILPPLHRRAPPARAWRAP